LLAALGDAVDGRTKELEIYTLTPPDEGYSIDSEVEGLARCAREAGLERFHLYGHSAGGAVALAFTAAHADSVLSLTLDEAAFDFSDEMRADLGGHLELQALLRDDPRRAMPQFMRLELRPGVEFQPPPNLMPLPNRPAGIATLLRTFSAAELPAGALERYDGPVLYTRGSLSADRYERSAQRLAVTFPYFEEVVFDGLHHLNTSHQAEPDRVAALLREHWARASVQI
jgi:pimeloyl-ACP methyl ester carboxylesterase